MHTQNRPISKNFSIPFTCLNREAKKWGYFEKKQKSFHLFETGNDSWGGVFENFLEKFFSLSCWKQEQPFTTKYLQMKKVCKTKISSRFIEPRGGSEW
ncbi:hypothetical protein MKD13_07140 [[Clostridium] innocuum]|nr:hypothetical protein [[Clostridium] innocuum]